MSGRGFAGMDPARHREIAAMGGRAVHAAGTGHEWTSEEAREAGRKGGREVAKRRGAEHMRAISKRSKKVAAKNREARELELFPREEDERC